MTPSSSSPPRIKLLLTPPSESVHPSLKRKLDSNGSYRHALDLDNSTQSPPTPTLTASSTSQSIKRIRLTFTASSPSAFPTMPSKPVESLPSLLPYESTATTLAVQSFEQTLTKTNSKTFSPFDKVKANSLKQSQENLLQTDIQKDAISSQTERKARQSVRFAIENNPKLTTDYEIQGTLLSSLV